MNNFNLDDIKKKAKKGVIVLTSRTALIQVIAYFSTFILTVLLTPEIFGVFFVVTAIVSFLKYFSDIGLSASLIQKKEEISDIDLTTTFTVQMALVTTIVIVGFIFSESLVGFYKLHSEGLWLFRSLLVAFYLSSLKTIPSIILERRLEFNKFVVPEIIETIFFYLTVVLLAALGWGITSFTIAVLVRSILGLIAIYIISPWTPKIGINRKSLKNLLSFGVPFQFNSLLALIKDDLLIVYLGKAIGFNGVSYVGWAKKWSEMPLRLIMDNINKVAFPAFSRLQHDKSQIASILEKSIFIICLLTIPIVFSGIILVQPLVNLIPRYVKWQPAVLSYYLFSITVIFASVSSLATNVLQAMGEIKVVFKLMIFWTVVTWVSVPIFIRLFNYNGVAISMFIISFSSVIPIYLIRQLTGFNLRKSLLLPFIVSVLTILPMVFIRILLPDRSLIQVFLILASGLIAFVVSATLLAKKELLAIFKNS